MSHDTSEALRARLQAAYPDAELELHRFPSRAWMLDMRLGDRLFVVSYMPAEEGFGYDEALEDSGLTASFTYRASDLEALIEGVARLVRNA